GRPPALCPPNGSGVRAGSRFRRYSPRSLTAAFHRLAEENLAKTRLAQVENPVDGVEKPARAGRSDEDAHRAELGATAAAELGGRLPLELAEALDQHAPQ